MNNTQFCNICKSTQFKFFLIAQDPDSEEKKEYNLLKCVNCKFIFLEQKKEDITFESAYSPSYWGRTKISNFFYNAIFLRERRSIITRLKRKGKLLDFGCGQGEFLEFMSEKRLDVYGVETPEYVNYALKHKRDLVIYYQDLNKIGFKENSFDAITMWHVFEHLATPGEYLKEIYRILKPEGYLIISVPNIDSLQGTFMKKNWLYLDLPRHINQFTPKTLTYILECERFSVRDVKHFSVEYNIFGWWQSLFNLIGCEKNFFYKYFKKGKLNKNFSKIQRIFSILATVVLGVPFSFIAIILSFFESILKRGGTITVIAVKKSL